MTEQEFSTLYNLSRKSFEKIAFSYTYDREAARDIVSDCFIYLWEHRSGLTQENIKGYIYLALRSRCISWLRKKSNAVNKETDDSVGYRIETSLASLAENTPAEHDIFSSELMELFRKSLSRMPELTRDIFTASRHEELTYQEIASRYNITVRKVTSEIQLALKLLRKALKDYCQ
ncbi:MAG: RNA polymerase sigma-70 factor [Bacteroidales bacterium]|nr:RNA polymerase sigma-70 factor [Bacteroidales bacterium]